MTMLVSFSTKKNSFAENNHNGLDSKKIKQADFRGDYENLPAFICCSSPETGIHVYFFISSVGTLNLIITTASVNLSSVTKLYVNAQ